MGARSAPTRIAGIAIGPGISTGRLHLHRQPLVIHRAVAEHPDKELARLETALSILHRRLEHLVDKAPLSRIGDHTEILQTYLMFTRARG